MAEISTIKVDPSALGDSAKELDELSQKLNGAKDKLISSIEGVKQGWKGKGADVFQEVLSDDWAVAVKRYCELLDVLVDIMRDASQTYDWMVANIEDFQYGIGPSSGRGYSGGGGRRF